MEIPLDLATDELVKLEHFTDGKISIRDIE